jgi:hypothetical protein
VPEPQVFDNLAMPKLQITRILALYQKRGIIGMPMANLVYLTGVQHAQVINHSNALMRDAIGQMQAAQPRAANEKADGYSEENLKCQARSSKSSRLIPNRRA